MALKGNPFEKGVLHPQLPTTGPRIKPKFEKIELGAVPSSQQTSSFEQPNFEVSEKEPNNSESRPVTTEAQPGQNPVTTEAQPGQNPVTTEAQPGQNPVTTEAQPGQNPVTKKSDKTPNPVKTRSETRLNFSENPPKIESHTNQVRRDYKMLVGNDEKVMSALFYLAQKNGSNQTIYFSRQKLSEEILLSYESVRTAIKRLKKFGILESVESTKGGPSSKVKASFSQDIYRSLCLDNDKNTPDISTITRLKPGQKPGQTPSSSSSINVLEDLKTTTTAAENKNLETASTQLSPEWLEIDYSALSEIHFSQSQLSQIAQLGKLTPIEVQDSVDAFAFDLKKNQRASGLKTSPLNFFMGILRRGMPYTPPENYESPEDEARRKYLESKRAQLARRQAMEKEILELEFQEWMDGLTREDRLKYAPDVRVDRSDMQKGYLKNYFEKHVYSKRSNTSEEPSAGDKQQQEELTMEQVRALADAQFGALKQIN